MRFSLYVIDHQTKNRVPIAVTFASEEDLRKTTEPPCWQTDWTSDFVRDSGCSLYSFKTIDNELVALAAYEICFNTIAVHIVYIESQSESNPATNTSRKYEQIGRAMIAFGIKLSVDAGFNGDITLDAKTTTLEEHYTRNYGAIKLPSRISSAAPRYLICDEAAINIFTHYLEEG